MPRSIAYPNPSPAKPSRTAIGPERTVPCTGPPPRGDPFSGPAQSTDGSPPSRARAATTPSPPARGEQPQRTIQIRLARAVRPRDHRQRRERNHDAAQRPVAVDGEGAEHPASVGRAAVSERSGGADAGRMCTASAASRPRDREGGERQHEAPGVPGGEKFCEGLHAITTRKPPERVDIRPRKGARAPLQEFLVFPGRHESWGNGVNDTHDGTGRGLVPRSGRRRRLALVGRRDVDRSRALR